MKVLFALVSIITLGGFVVAQSPRTLKVRESNILTEIAERKVKQPAITANELTAFANELLEQKGFDYSFEVCDILSPTDKKSTAESISKRYRASLTNSQALTLNLDVSNQDGLCGECWLLVPSRRVTKREIHLVANGKTYRIRRTPAFHLDEAQLVDETMKNVLRKWEFPDQSVPIGISVDGTKLYLDVYVQEGRLDDLVLEVSEDGTLAFRDRNGLELKEGKELENFPRDPKNAYLSFVKFEVGNKTYIVRYIAPCT